MAIASSIFGYISYWPDSHPIKMSSCSCPARMWGCPSNPSTVEALLSRPKVPPTKTPSVGPATVPPPSGASNRPSPTPRPLAVPEVDVQRQGLIVKRQEEIVRLEAQLADLTQGSNNLGTILNHLDRGPDKGDLTDDDRYPSAYSVFKRMALTHGSFPV